MKSETLDFWRDYFRTANSDIFGIIEQAIKVAATDCPQQFKLRRDQIAETLFSCRLARCSGCDRVKLSVPKRDENEDLDEEGCKSTFDGDDDGGDYGCGKEGAASKESSRVNRSELNENRIRSYSSLEAEALTDEIGEESRVVAEVLRMKEALNNNHNESDSVLLECLRKLQLAPLTVETLKVTEIGKAVNGLRKRGSKEVRLLARTLIDQWKMMVDEWVISTTNIAEGTPDSVNPSIVEEEGLPSPPLDEGAFLATQTTSMELSQFFDGIDDDGNPRNIGEFDKSSENGRKPAQGEDLNIPRPKGKPSIGANVPGGDNRIQPIKPQAAALKPNKPTIIEPKLNSTETKCQPKLDKAATRKRPFSGQDEKVTLSEDEKLEASTRKIQQRYKEAANDKKQRTIQMVEFNDLPKQGRQKISAARPTGNHNRFGERGRR